MWQSHLLQPVDIHPLGVAFSLTTQFALKSRAISPLWLSSTCFTGMTISVFLCLFCCCRLRGQGVVQPSHQYSSWAERWGVPLKCCGWSKVNQATRLVPTTPSLMRDRVGHACGCCGFAGADPSEALSRLCKDTTTAGSFDDSLKPTFSKCVKVINYNHMCTDWLHINIFLITCIQKKLWHSFPGDVLLKSTAVFRLEGILLLEDVPLLLLFLFQMSEASLMSCVWIYTLLIFLHCITFILLLKNCLQH